MMMVDSLGWHSFSKLITLNRNKWIIAYSTVAIHLIIRNIFKFWMRFISMILLFFNELGWNHKQNMKKYKIPYDWPEMNSSNLILMYFFFNLANKLWQKSRSYTFCCCCLCPDNCQKFCNVFLITDEVKWPLVWHKSMCRL